MSMSNEVTPCCATGDACLHGGLFVLRVGIGILFMVHGIPKLMGGVANWEALGGAMGVMGIHFAPAFWGFMAALSEGLGGLCLVLGLFVRPFAALMAFTMIVATLMLVQSGAGFAMFSNPLHMAVVFSALTITGAGRCGLGKKIPGLRQHWFC
mgnify:CR=1 FL=1